MYVIFGFDHIYLKMTRKMVLKEIKMKKPQIKILFLVNLCLIIFTILFYLKMFPNNGLLQSSSHLIEVVKQPGVWTIWV